MLNTKNMQAKEINQKRGPQTGNAGNKEKRDAFMSEKNTRSSEKAQLANMITDALEMRGRGQAGKINPALESLHDKTNVGRGPTKGNAGKRNSTMGKKGANGATSGY
jgi:hypothetical protein